MFATGDRMCYSLPFLLHSFWHYAVPFYHDMANLLVGYFVPLAD